MVHKYYVILEQINLTMMEVHPINNVSMIQFIADIPMIHLFHIMLYHVNIGFNEINLVIMSDAYLGEFMHYHHTQIYDFAANHIIIRQSLVSIMVCNMTTVMPIITIY